VTLEYHKLIPKLQSTKSNPGVTQGNPEVTQIISE